MHDDTIEIRQPAADPESLKRWIRPITAAFGNEHNDAMFDIDKQLWEMDRLIGAVDGETWVGGASASRCACRCRGKSGGRAVRCRRRPTHRRRGVLTRMMRWLLDQAAERGEPVSILHASEGAIYPRFGFGLATLQGTFEADRSAFQFSRPAEMLGRVRLVEGDEAMRLVPPVFEAVFDERVGEVNRTPDKWRLQLLADDPWRRSVGVKYTALLEVAGETRGYAIYRIKNDWDDRGPKSTLTVMEVTGWTRRRACFVGVARRRRSRPDRRRLAPTRPAAAVPHAEGPAPPRPDRERRPVVAVGGPAPGARGAHDAGAGSVTLEVADAFIPANAGRWIVTVPSDRGVASVERVEAGVEPDLLLDTTDLAAVYLGAFKFADLARAGRVWECREGAVAEADRLFSTPSIPWSSTMF